MIITLDNLKQFFDRHKMSTKYVEISPLLIYLEVIYKSFADKKYKCELNVLSKELISGIYDSGDTFELVQIGYAFPFILKKSCLEDTLKLLAHFNGTCLLPGLAWDPLNEKILYRVMIHIPAHRHLSGDMLLGLFHTFIQQIEILEQPVHDVARGYVHYEKLVRESQDDVIDSVKNLLPMLTERLSA
jgi:hypothetical protein